MRDVYPGFLQLNGFISMNLDRHIEAHRDLFMHLVKGDGDSAQKHKEFYDEYLAVMDLAAEFYLQTVDTVFVRHALPKGEMTHRDRPRRSGPDQARRAADHRRRTRRHFRRRPDRGGPSAVRQSSRRPARRIGCSPASAITACSTARASAPRSRRASPTSSCRMCQWRAAQARRAPPDARRAKRASAARACRPALAAGPSSRLIAGRVPVYAQSVHRCRR